MRRWDVEGGIGIGDPFVGHEGEVWSVAVNEDHDLIASGGKDWSRQVDRVNQMIGSGKVAC